jgi:hypothetical protein
VNKVKPGTIPENQICKKKNPNTFEVTNNLGLALEGARKIGCNIVNIGPQDLANQTPHLILGLIWQVIRIDLLGQVSVEKHPEMMLLKEEHEDALTFASVTPEQNLLRWVNYHLKRAGTDRRISNFSSDIRDAVPYTYLLNQLAPGQCSLDGLREPDPLRRAELALQGADRLGCRKFVTPEDIVNGNAKLNLAFVAYLFNRYPGLEAREADDEAERRAREAELKKVLELKARAEEEARAAQAAAEAARREHEERLRRLEEEEAARRRQWELEEAERRRRWEEEEARRKREWEEAEARRRQQEEEMKRRAAEMLESQRREMEERQRQEEEARRRQWQAEEEARRRQRQIEEEARRRQQAAYEEEMRRRQQAEEEARKKAEYDAWLAQQQQYYAQTTTTTAYYPQAYQTYYQTYYAQPTAYVYTQPTTYVTGQTWPIPRMFVSVMEGRQLVKKDWMGLGKSDPYAVVECKGRRFQTTYQKNTQYPVWGETFEFNQVGQNDELRISIWDYDSIGACASISSFSLCLLARPPFRFLCCASMQYPPLSDHIAQASTISWARSSLRAPTSSTSKSGTSCALVPAITTVSLARSLSRFKSTSMFTN